MSRKNIVILAVSIILFVLGIWSKSTLPFLCIVLLVDSARNKPYRKAVLNFLKEKLAHNFKWAEWAGAIALAIWLVVFAQGNFWGIYTFHTSSMHQTLQVGDVLLVDKLVPGPRHGSDKISDYTRSLGISKLKYKDAIMFNFPEGDTLLKSRPTESYHYLKRLYGKDNIGLEQESDVSYFKVSERTRFVKRIYGLPGDSIRIVNGYCFVNGKKLSYPKNAIDRYVVDDKSIGLLKQKGIVPYNEHKDKKDIYWELSEEDYAVAKQHASGIKPDNMLKNFPDPLVFPFNSHLLWNMHHMGPIYIPKKGDRIKLNALNMQLYRRAIEVFEENEVNIKGEEVWINGQEAQDYTFKMDYYWVIGDNRPHSFDSRFWGFVPENHIIGKVKRILLSRDIQKKGWIYLRKSRILKKVR